MALAGFPGAESVLAGALLVVLGYLVKFRGWTFLLAGHDPDNVVDEEGLGNLYGGNILRIGLAVIAYGAITAAGLATPLFETIFTVAIVLAVLRLVYRGQKYRVGAS